MKIDINKDFEEKYKNTYKGLTGGEAATAAVALVIAGITAWMVWFHFGLPINVSVYLGIPVMVPVILLGIFKYQGMSLPELIKEFLYSVRTKELPYEAEEYNESYRRVFSMERRVNRKNGSV